MKVYVLQTGAVEDHVGTVAVYSSLEKVCTAGIEHIDKLAEKPDWHLRLRAELVLVRAELQRQKYVSAGYRLLARCDRRMVISEVEVQ